MILPKKEEIGYDKRYLFFREGNNVPLSYIISFVKWCRPEMRKTKWMLKILFCFKDSRFQRWPLCYSRDYGEKFFNNIHDRNFSLLNIHIFLKKRKNIFSPGLRNTVWVCICLIFTLFYFIFSTYVAWKLKIKVSLDLETFWSILRLKGNKLLGCACFRNYILSIYSLSP